MDILDPITGEVLYTLPDNGAADLSRSNGDNAFPPTANNTPMNGGQSDPAFAPAIGQPNVIGYDDYGTPVYSDISSANYTYDAGGSAIDLPAFKAAQSVTDAAIAGAPIDKTLLQKMAAAGMDVSTVKTLGGAVWRLVAQPNGNYVAQATNTQATAAQSSAKTKQYIMYAGLGLLAYLGLS